MVDIAEITKYETEGNFVLEENKNTMKCKMKIKRGSINFEVDNAIAPY